MATSNGNFDWKCKLVIIGDSSVGKTCIMRRFTDGEFSFNYAGTLGVDFTSKMVAVGDKVVKVQIWDTAGTERYRALAPSYYRGAKGALVVYDITEPKTFVSVKKWVANFKRFTGPSTKCILIGNKCDLTDNRQIPTSDGKTFANKQGMMFAETSAKSDINVADAFKEIIASLTKQHTVLRSNRKNEKLVNFTGKSNREGCC